MYIRWLDIIAHISKGLFLIFNVYFPLCSSNWIIYINPSSCSTISSAISHQLLSLSCDIFLSDILISSFSICIMFFFIVCISMFTHYDHFFLIYNGGFKGVVCRLQHPIFLWVCWSVSIDYFSS